MFSFETRCLFEQEKKFGSATYVDLLKQRAFELDEELRAVRMRLNSFSLPDRLPTELLEKVFMQHVLELNSDWEENNRHHWVGVSQVCRRWREVAVNYAPLWTTIILSHPKFMKLMLTRSKGEPIEFTFDLDYMGFSRQPPKGQEMHEATIDMLSQIHRFRSMRIFMNQWGTPPSMYEILSKVSGHAPNLLELRIAGSTDPTPWDRPFPLSFLEGGAPALQLLELRGVSISWHCIPLPSTLTSLSLCRGALRPSMSEFYRSLSTLDALQDLSIANWLPVPDDSMNLPSPPPSFALPCLKAARVEGDCEEITQFFGIVRAPEVVSMNVTFNDLHISGRVIVECIENIRTAVDEAMNNFQSISAICLWYFDAKEPSSRPSIVEILYEPSGATQPSHTLPHLTFGFSSHYQPHNSFEILTSINKAFTFITAKTLHVVSCRDIDPTSLLEIFSPLPELKELTLSSTPVARFFRNMGRDPALQRNDLQPYFPALSEINLCSINFADSDPILHENVELSDDSSGEEWSRWDVGAHDEARAFAPEVLGYISTALEQRPDTHCVRKLAIEKCKNFGQKCYDSLSGSMSSRTYLSWDGLDLYGTPE